jgi:hypothetical protein
VRYGAPKNRGYTKGQSSAPRKNSLQNQPALQNQSYSIGTRINLPLMRPPPTPLSPNRLARLIVCAQVFFVWAAAAYVGNLAPNRRHIRQRFRLLSLDKLAQLVRNLMIARAALLFVKPRPRRATRDHARSGFRKRIRMRKGLRAIGGSRLRHHLNGGDDLSRFTRLAHMLWNLDRFTETFFKHRARNGLTRLLPIVLVHAIADALCCLSAPTAFQSDTS